MSSLCNSKQLSRGAAKEKMKSGENLLCVTQHQNREKAGEQKRQRQR
jgi:hypothetical protein